MFSSTRYVHTHVIGMTVLLALLAWAVGQSNLDMTIAHLTFDDATQAFIGRHSPLLSLLADRVMVAGPVLTATAALILIGLSLRRPALQPLRGVCVAVVAVIVAGPLLILMLKHLTALPRPHMLQIFGGALAMPTRFFAGAGQPSGGALPSTHAGAGYTLVALYFAGLALGRRDLMGTGLLAALALGGGMSALRIVQGAHFLSQTLWSATVLWLLASLIFLPLMLARSRAAQDADRLMIPRRVVDA